LLEGGLHCLFRQHFLLLVGLGHGAPQAMSVIRWPGHGGRWCSDEAGPDGSAGSAAGSRHVMVE
jgi:hypothetical protein